MLRISDSFDSVKNSVHLHVFKGYKSKNGVIEETINGKHILQKDLTVGTWGVRASQMLASGPLAGARA